MDQTLKNLQAARDYWDTQHTIARATIAYVIAQPTGHRVLANNMSVMLSGCCTPELFSTATVAIAHERKLSAEMWDFDGEPQLETMNFDAFCSLQMERFETALQAARVADAMARQSAVAA